MTAKNFRAAAAALLLGAATLGGATLLATAPAQAAVRASVGEPLAAGDEPGRQGRLQGRHGARSKRPAPCRTRPPEESSTIAQVKAYVGAKSGDISLGGAAAAKNKLASDYSAKKYTRR